MFVSNALLFLILSKIIYNTNRPQNFKQYYLQISKIKTEQNKLRYLLKVFSLNHILFKHQYF